MQDQEEKKADEIDIFINSRACDCFMCHMCSLGDKRDEGEREQVPGHLYKIRSANFRQENGKIPLLLQWDERWGYGIYVDNMIAVNGCGPTAVAMVASGLTGDDSITPYRVAQSAAEQGYYEDGVGTSWQFMTEGVQQYGIYGEEMALSENTVFTALENGQPIICSMGAGDFTTTGHFIVLTGVEDGKIIVNDPNSKEKSEKRWEYERLEPQINNLWVYDLF